MISIISLIFILLLSLLITRIATVALTLTGLSRQTARFQARSAFSGVGYTTDESEKLVNHPVRRRILLVLMLAGNAGIVTAMTSLILSFVNNGGAQSFMLKTGVLVAGLLLLLALAQSSWVDRRLSNLVTWALKTYTSLEVRDYAALLHLAGDYRIAEMQVQPDDWMAGRLLGELNLISEGIIVLGVTRKDGSFIGAPHGETQLNPHDNLLLYGRAASFEKLEDRPRGLMGDIVHMRSIDEQKEVETEQQRLDPESELKKE
jgi:hypothetical protein